MDSPDSSHKPGPHFEPQKPAKSTAKKLNSGPFSALVVTIFSYIGAYGAAILSLGVGIGLVAELVRRDFEDVAKEFERSVFGQFSTAFVIYASMLGLVYLFMRYRKISFSSIGLNRLPKWKDLGYAVIVGIVYGLVLGMLLAVIENTVPGIDLEQEQQLGFDMMTQGPALILIFAALVILPPLVEEIIMRGFLYTGLRQKLKIPAAAVITSLVFAVAHLQIGSDAPPLYVAAIDTFVLSMFLIWLRERTGSLWSGIILHGLKNGLAFTLLFIVGIS